MRQSWGMILLVATGAATAIAADGAGVVQSVRFETSVTPPVYVVPQSLKRHEASFRAGLEKLPEGLLVTGALAVGGRELGLSGKQAVTLGTLIADTYAKIGADRAFRDVPSALPYCFATEKYKTGHYFLYRPAELPAQPRWIVFLHGYGGNFLFYTWVLKEEFPDAVILVPSWSAGWADGSPKYVENLLADARHRCGTDPGRPWLLGISAGGRGGFSIYNQLHQQFAGYICLASLPGTSTAQRLRRDLKILMINGTDDDLVPLAWAHKQADLARQSVPSLQFTEIAGDHFFLLSKREAAFGPVRQFMKTGK